MTYINDAPGEVLTAEKVFEQIGREFFIQFEGSRCKLLGASQDGKYAFIYENGRRKMVRIGHLRSVEKVSNKQ